MNVHNAFLPRSIRAHSPVLMEEGPRAGLPAHYGWTADEQDRFEGGSAYVYLGQIGVVRVTGSDRISWLTNMFSQTLEGMATAASAEALLLDPQGRIEYQMGVVADEDVTWLLVAKDKAADLTAFLDSMRFMMQVEVENASADYRAVLTDNELARPDQSSFDRTTDALGGVTWVDPWPEVTPGGTRYYTGDHPGADHQFRIHLVPADQMDSLVEDLQQRGLTPAGVLAAEAARIAAWRPTAAEVDDRTVPSELDALRTAVHLEKGCYRGQESVARIVNLGRPPRRLTLLHLDGSGENTPQPGDPVEHNGGQVGHVTSVAEHWVLGPVALALVKRTLDPTLQIKAGGADATQEVIVPFDGKSEVSPTQRPGSGMKRLQGAPGDMLTTGTGAK